MVIVVFKEDSSPVYNTKSTATCTLSAVSEGKGIINFLPLMTTTLVSTHIDNLFFLCSTVCTMKTYRIGQEH